MNATVERTEWLNRQQLEQLAQDKKNRVFAYTYDKPEEIMPADQVRDRLREVRERYLALKSEHPEWEDDKLRHHICSEKFKWKSFARTHSLNFTNATSSDTNDEKMQYQYYMLYVKKQVEEGLITEEQSRAMVREYMLKASMKKQPKKNPPGSTTGKK